MPVNVKSALRRCPEALLEEVRKTALEAHRCLGLTGYSRTDFILGDDGAVHVLEVNTLPGMTPASLVPKEAAALGMDFGELLEVLLKEPFCAENNASPDSG